MLTLYSIVKGFEGHTGVIQRNAIRSWLDVLPDAQIVLFGDNEPDARATASEFGLTILSLPRNEFGAPLLPAVIRAAHGVAQYDTKLLVNADIILSPGIADAVAAVESVFDEFLLVTHRMKVHVNDDIDFDTEGDWFKWLRGLDCKMGISSAIDLFCYRGDWLRDVPPFGVGRTSWDNWMLGKARQEDVPIIDGTPTFLAWHQEHPVNKPKNQMNRNRALYRASGVLGDGTLNMATWVLGEGRLTERKQR